MGALYKVRLFDSSGNLLAVLENSTGEQEHRRFNQAGDIQFSLPATDPKAKFIELATRFEIWRKDERITSGRIDRRDVSGDPWTAFGFTPETLLAGIQTPGNIEINGGASLLSDSPDLAHIFGALTYDYKVLSLNRAFDENHVAAETDADTCFELEDQIALKKDAENTYPAVNLGDAKGRVCFQFSVPEGYELFRLRWLQQVAETCEIVFRYRTSSNGGSTWSSWSNWIGHGDSQETSAAQGYPLTHPAGAETVQIQFQLLNSDTETVTEGYDDAGEPIVIYGSTPILEAIELVCRQEAALRKVVPHDTDWPSEATVDVTDVQLHYHNGLQAMVEIAEKFGYEFYVDDDCRLHLGKQLGVDRSNEIIFRASHNMNIVQLEDNRQGMCNILTCLGAGDGLDQLKATVTNDESIREYGPHPDKQEWKDVETLAELESKGREVVGMSLADPGERGAPKQTFRIQGIVKDDLPAFYLGDTVRIVIPKDGVNTTGRILEVVRGPSDKGDAVDIMINRTRASVVDRIVQAIERIPIAKPPEARKPARPTNVRATGEYRRIVVQWQARAGVLSRVYHSVSKDGPYAMAYQGPDRKWVHEPVEIGETHHYKVAVVVDGIESDLVGPVRATVPGVPRGDLDQTPPGNVAWDTCEFLREIILRWFPTALAAEYEIRSVDDDWGETEGCVWRGNATTITLRPTQRTHTYYIRAISAAGVYSLEATRITLTNATPGTPPPPEVMEFFSALRIAIRPVSDDDIESYTLYMTPCDAQGDPVGETLAIPVGFAPVTYQASPGCRFRIEVAARDVLGEGGKSTPIYAATNSLAEADIPEGIIGESKLTESLMEEIESAVDGVDYLDGQMSEALQRLSQAESELDSVDGQMSEALQRLSQAESELDSIDGRVTDTETKITELEGEIATKVSQTDHNTLAGRVETAETNITQNAQAIATKASQSSVDTLEGRVSTAETTITQQAQEIASKASQSSVDTLEGRVSTAETTITQHGNAISSVVSEVESIDGRVETAESAITQLGSEITLKVQRRQDGKLVIAGIGVAVDETGQSEVAMLADRFRILTSTDGEMKSVFAVDTVTGKVYILGDLIAEGLMRAHEVQAEVAKALLLQAELVTADQADVLWLRADRISVGGQAPGIALMKPEGARLWHFDGSLTGTQGETPLSGAVATLRPDGRFGGCVAVEVGTTNLAGTDNSFEEGRNDFIAYAGKGTVSQSSDYAYLGTASLKFVCSETGSTGVVKTLGSHPGKTLTLTWKVMGVGSAIGKQVYANIYDNVTGSTAGSSVTLNGTWQTIQVTKTIDSGATQTSIYWLSSMLAPGDTVYADCVQLEEHSFPTSFTTGTRAAGKLEYEVTYGDRGTLRWLMTGSGKPLDPNGTAIFNLNPGASSDKRNDIWQTTSASLGTPGAGQVVWINTSGGWSPLTCELSIDPGDWLDCSATWNKTTKLRTLTVHNLTKGVSNSVSANDADTLVFGDRLLYDYSGTGSYLADVLYDEVMLWNQDATPEQVAAWYAMGAPFHDPQGIVDAASTPVHVDGAGGTLHIDSQGETWTRKSDGKVMFRFDANTGDAEYAGQLGAKVIEADDYKQVPVVDTYNVMDSFDASHPLEIPIYIDEGMTIHDVRITARGMRYRAYASGASAGGSHSHDVEIEPHTHTIPFGVVPVESQTAGIAVSVSDHSSHSHSYDKVSSETANALADLTWSTSTHRHSFSDSDTVYVSVSGSTDQVGGTGWYHGHLVTASGSGSASISGDTGDSSTAYVHNLSQGYHKHGISTAPANTSSGGPTTHVVTMIPLNGVHKHIVPLSLPLSATESGGAQIQTSTAADSHTHSLVYGIFDDTSANGLPRGVDLYLSNSESRSNYVKVADLPEPPSGADEFQLCKELVLPVSLLERGWKWVKFTTTTKGRVSAHIVIRGFQDSWEQ